MDIFSKAVHAGDRKKPGKYTPSTTPIVLASSFQYDNVETLDRIFGHEEDGPSYARYENPTNSALEEQVTALENGAGTLACASGMAAIHTAILCALIDRPRSILAASDLYGATIKMLMQLIEPFGVSIRFADFCNLDAVRAAVAESKPGILYLESVSNPLLRVAELDKIAEIARSANAALLVDNTFPTPLLMRPLDLGAHIVVHSATKYLAGHGDVLGGLITCDAENLEPIRAWSRIAGPVMGPFEAYLTMRGIKSFPVRMERHCVNALRVAEFLSQHPRVEKVHYTGLAGHPDAAVIQRLFPKNLYGGIVSFEIKGAGKPEVFRFMDALKMIVRGTTLGDVHSLLLYPLIASHRDLSPKQRARMGITDSMVRLSVGIEGTDDILADLDQALNAH